MAAAKYQWVEKLGHVQPLLESPVNKVAFLPGSTTCGRS